VTRLRIRRASRERAARDGGGGDPDANPRLRLAVQLAREANMPMENIERAIKRGAGGGDGVSLAEITYEGYGPGGAAILVESMTDNRNRTVAEVRNAFTRGGGNMGELGCVGWLFDSRGVILVEVNGSDPDEVALMAIDAGADDVRVEDSAIEIFTTPSDLDRVRNALMAEKLKVASAELAMVPKTILEADPKDALAVLKLMERLEDLDDVQRVYTNVDFSDDVLEQLGGR